MTTPGSDLVALTAALGDRYVVEHTLGHGGMATVYLAQDVRHGRAVAIKVLRPELYSPQFAERFVAEIRVTAGLQHPHILPLFDSGASGMLLYYVMPYVTGETLRDRLIRDPQLGVAEAVRIAREVSGALDYAHRLGVVHRDIKPENILFQDGAALVADFGIAFSVATHARGERLTATGMSIGTPAYMSPEQASGERVLDARSDVYAVGAVLYEMLAGAPPHTGASAQAVLAKVLTTDPIALTARRADVPPTLAAVVMRALAREPADRWESAAALAHALQESTQSRARVTWARPRGRARRPFLIGAAVLAISAAAAMAAWRTRADTEATSEAPPVVTAKRQVTFNGSVENVGVSPDGRFLAYAAHGEDSLFVFSQDLDGGGNPIKLASLANADVTSLGWSPDGTKILLTGVSGTTPLAFVIAPLGGDVRQLPVASMIRGIVPFGTWLPDGARVALWSHDEQPDHRLTILDTKSGDTSSRALTGIPFPSQGSWSANGLLVSQVRDSTNELLLVSQEGIPQRIAQSSTMAFGSPNWSASMRAVFAIRGLTDLVRIPVRANTSAPSDSVTVVASGLEAWGYDDQFAMTTLSLSRNDHRAVYTRAVRHSNIQYLAADGRARPLTSTTTMKWVGMLSPDGTRLAYVERVAGKDNLWILDLASGVTRQLTFSTVLSGDFNSNVAWSPDGQSLAFVERVNGVPVIGVVAAAGGGAASYFEGTASMPNGISWAPARDILFSDASGNTIRAVDPQTRAVSVVVHDSTGDHFNVVPSADGTRVAFYKMAKNSERTGLWIATRNGSARQISNAYVMPLSWTEDGQALIARSGSARDIVRLSLDGRSRIIARAPTRADLCLPAGASAPRAFVCTTPVSVADAWLLELSHR